MGQATEQAGQAAQEITQQTQDVAGGATQKAQGTAQQATQQDSAEQHEEATSGQQPQATSGASQKAEELGVDLSEVEGTGPDGRITLKDVKAPPKNSESLATVEPFAITLAFTSYVHRILVYKRYG